MRPLRLLCILGAAGLLAAGPVLFSEDRAPVAASVERTALPAPAWKLKDLDGREVTSEQFKGKVVVLDFWATWCTPCIGEIPGYVALQKKYGAAGLVVVGVSLDRRGPGPVKKFAQANGMNYTLVMGDDETVEAFANSGGGDTPVVFALPTTFLISRDGRILNQKTGAAPAEEYEKLVQSALK